MVKRQAAKDTFAAGKQALDDENELLQILYNAANTHITKVTPGTLGHRIITDWLNSFYELRLLNEELIASNDRKYRQWLNEEIEALEIYIQTTKDHKLGKSWKRFFKGDLKIAKDLLEE